MSKKKEHWKLMEQMRFRLNHVSFKLVSNKPCDIQLIRIL